MLPEYPKFKKLDIEDLDLVAKHLRMSERKICELSPANFFLWTNFDHSQYTFINQNLCVLISNPKEAPYFFEPLGKKDLEATVAACLKHSKKISRVSEGFISALPPNPYKIKCLRDQYDYVYLARDLAELKGRKFDGKRNHIKNFTFRHPEYEFKALGPDHKKDALALFEKWFEGKKDTAFFDRLAYSAQKNALEKAFLYFEELKLTGGALSIGGSLKGFILGSPLNPQTIDVHFEYRDPELQGVYQVLLWEACRKTFSSFTHINLEQDLGIPGLRKSKLSYHPLKLEKKFELLLA